MRAVFTCTRTVGAMGIGAGAVVLMLMGLMGCAQHGPFEPWMRLSSIHTASFAARTSGGPSQQATALQNDSSATPKPVTIRKDAGPETYVRLALARSPAIQAAHRHISRLKARIGQVTSLDDPMFSVSPVGQMAQTATGEVGLMTSLSQKLPWPGKLDARGKIAKAAVAGASAELKQVQLRVADQTRKAYWQLYAAARSLEQIKRTRPLLVAIQRTATAQLRAGQGSQADVLRSSVEVSELDRQTAGFKKQHDTAVAMLNRLMDRPAGAAIPDPPTEGGGGGVLEDRQVNLQKHELLAEAARHNPAIAKVQAKIAANNQRLRLAKLARIPDLTVGVHYNAVDDSGVVMTPSGRDQWWLSFGITLPIWNGKYDAMQREALASILESSSRLQDAKQQLGFQVQSALFAVNNQQTQLRLFRQEIVPQAKQAAQDALAGYRSGNEQFVDALDAWRRLLTLELAEAQNRAALGEAMADLRKAVGGAAISNGDAHQSTIKSFSLPPTTAPATQPQTKQPKDKP